MQINIAHLYPDLMNIYSDMGNIICLKKRCQWRGIKVKVTPISIKQKLDWQKYDLFFGGGGQDRQQLIISKDLQKKKKALKEAVEQGIPMLTTCGTYQLFGHYFKTHQGVKIAGISIFDAHTIASYQRKIGNIVIDASSIMCHASCDNKKSATCHVPRATLVGFENHSGNTFLAKSSKLKAKSLTFPLGKVIKGFGNNGQDGTEGTIYKNCIGTYLHGPVLPKNPHLADWLITKALEKKYKRKVELKSLDDKLEWQTHQAATKRTYQAK